MKYNSTRGTKAVTPQQAIIQGIAEDGGLFINEKISDVKFTTEMLLQLDPFDISAIILNALLPGYEDMRSLVEKAYAGKFKSEQLTPLVEVGKDFVLELFHGPTSAFKDVALCMLPQLMTSAKKTMGITEDITILTATSGDTGKAALSGFADVEGVNICVFYPNGGVSAVQKAQMVTQEGKNVHGCAVNGNFDDCQTAVKKAFAELKNEEGIRLSSANSINIGRLAPQVVYYFLAYKQLLESQRIQMDDVVDFVVPTGNFGDILAGFYAKCLGLPVGKLICASNENNVLSDFFKTGVYDKNREFYKTTSPSMDILVSSNLERLIYLACDGDYRTVSDYMTQLSTTGKYKANDKIMGRLRSVFGADFATADEVSATIDKYYKDYNYLMDPHTAVAFAVREKMQLKNRCVVLSTASPYKFPEAVLKAIGAKPAGDEFEQILQLEDLTGVIAPDNLKNLNGKPVLHTDVIEKDEINKYVVGLFKKK
ncbi:MAG: threonine synthase [Clostridia bacterium]|nr:threonine synthase [Clostridia bacterium]